MRIAQNMISVAGVCDNGCTVQVSKSSCVIKTKKKVLDVGRRTEGMYAVRFKKVGKNNLLLTHKRTSAI